MITCIYRLVDSRTDEVRYIGQATDLAKREKDHRNLRSIQGNVHLCRWKCDLKKRGFDFRIEVIEECQADELDERERYWIRQLRAEGAPLLNVLDGGSGRAKTKVLHAGKSEVLETCAELRDAIRGVELAAIKLFGLIGTAKWWSKYHKVICQQRLLRDDVETAVVRIFPEWRDEVARALWGKGDG